MPKGFEVCQRNGGRIRTVSGPDKQFGLGEGEYMPVCYLNGEAHLGEIHKKKEEKHPKETIKRVR